MSQGLYIDAKQLTKGAAAFDKLVKALPDRVSDVLNANAEAIAKAAKRAAPADRGQVEQGINFTRDNSLQKHITSQAPYSAYIEFGTGKYAAQQVAKYPPEYQAFAAQYQKGRRWPPIKPIMEWILRKGIVATFNIQTRKRVGTGKSKAEQQRAAQMAYVIARSIFINGVHPHPFLIPALINQQPKIIKDMKRFLKTL